MENKLLNELAACGCRVESLLDDTYMGREDFYVKVLKRLPESTAFVRLEAALKAGDVKAGFESAHELKGLYATLGLTPAYDLACRIVEILRPLASTNGAPELLLDLRPLHERFLALIAAS